MLKKNENINSLVKECWFNRTILGKIISGLLVVIGFIPVILGIFLLKLYQKIKKIK